MDDEVPGDGQGVPGREPGGVPGGVPGRADSAPRADDPVRPTGAPLADPVDDLGGVTAPQPVVTTEDAAAAVTALHSHESIPHHHEGEPSEHASIAGHHVAAEDQAPDPRHSAGRRRGLAAVAAVIAAILVLGATAAYAMTRPQGSDLPAAGSTALGAGEEPAGATSPSASTMPSRTALAPSAPMLVLGDSLGLVVYPYLADLLPDRYVSYAAEVGRSTASTVAALAALPSIPPVVIVSSGTNDQFATDVRAQADALLDKLGSHRCVVWVDVVRPDRIGDPQTAINAAIDAAAAGRPQVTVLHWSAMIQSHPEWLAGDGIHPTEAGARARAQAFADAAKACSPVDPTAPRAARQVLPNSVFWGPLAGQGSASGSSSGTSSSSGAGSSGGSGSTGTGSRSSSSGPPSSPASGRASPPPTSHSSSPAVAPTKSPSAATSAPPSAAPTTSAPPTTDAPAPTTQPATTAASEQSSGPS